MLSISFRFPLHINSHLDVDITNTNTGILNNWEARSRREMWDVIFPPTLHRARVARRMRIHLTACQQVWFVVKIYSFPANLCKRMYSYSALQKSHFLLFPPNVFTFISREVMVLTFFFFWLFYLVGWLIIIFFCLLPPWANKLQLHRISTSQPAVCVSFLNYT